MKDIQGIQRGKCNSCECEEYRAPVESGRLRCEYCNHTPGEHVKIIELGACRSCGQDDCDKYVSEDPNSYTDCQYCGCSANSHAGAEALRKPKPVQPGGTVPVTAVAGTSNIPANFPQPPGIQPRMTADGKVAQTSVLGKCALPECPYPRSVEANRVHDYCSRTCAQKHATQKQQAHMHMQPLTDPTGSPPKQRVLVQAQERTVIMQRPGGPPQATTVVARKMPSQQPSWGGGGGVTPIGGTGVGGGGGGVAPIGGTGVGGGNTQLCKECGVRPANLGRSWCQQCYINKGT